MSEQKADIGLIGLAVMGQNLVLNMASKGYRVAVFNRTTATMQEFVDRIRTRPSMATPSWPTSWRPCSDRGAC